MLQRFLQRLYDDLGGIGMNMAVEDGRALKVGDGLAAPGYANQRHIPGFELNPQGFGHTPTIDVGRAGVDQRRVRALGHGHQDARATADRHLEPGAEAAQYVDQCVGTRQIIGND